MSKIKIMIKSTFTACGREWQTRGEVGKPMEVTHTQPRLAWPSPAQHSRTF